ncbi:hypothetical protein [Solimonas soli]|uniref:hypothetical protein n=1 Tax=Solimonas soli TaxID=413479 RepID=UPI0004885A94|nr:hypothetical protein [Solimonas soli]
MKPARDPRASSRRAAPSGLGRRAGACTLAALLAACAAAPRHGPDAVPRDSAALPQASGYEPPATDVPAPSGSDAPPVQTHAAAPAPDVQEKPSPPAGLPDKADTPAATEQVFTTDASGLTSPGAVVPKNATDRYDRPITPSRLCDQAVPPNEQAIDMTRRRVEEMVCASSMWFDGLFGDYYYVGESRKVYGNIELAENWSQFYGNKVRLRFDARVDLPNINQHLSAFIGRDDEEDFIRDRLDNTTLRNNFPQVEDHDKVFAGLGYALPSNNVFRTDLRAGVRGLASPEAFVQARARYNAYSDDNDLVLLRATPFWTTSDHLGITLGADYSHVLTDDLLFRWGNVGTRSQSTQGVDWRVTWTLYQAMRRIKSGFAYELFVRGETGDDVPLHEYGAQTTFRHPLFKGRLYAEWVLGYSFPREDRDDDRRGSVLAGAGLQMPFGLREQP